MTPDARSGHRFTSAVTMSSTRAASSRSPLKAEARVGSPVAAESLKSAAGASLSMRTLRGSSASTTEVSRSSACPPSLCSISPSAAWPHQPHVQHQRAGLGRDLVERLLGRHAGVDQCDAPHAMRGEARDQLAHHRLEGVGRQMLAAGERGERRVVAEADDRRRHHRQPLDQLLAERPRRQRVGLERQVRAVRLRRRADRDDDDDIGSNRCLASGQVRSSSQTPVMLQSTPTAA